MNIRKGQIYRRRSDGFMFRVDSYARDTKKWRAVPGAFMRCVHATRIFGWFDADVIIRDFDRVKA